MATQSCAFPLYEVENGVYTISRKPKEKLPMMEYMKLQGRYRHLPQEIIEEIQKDVDRNWDLLLQKEEFTRKFAEKWKKE